MKENAHAGAVEAISIDNLNVAVIFRKQMVIGFVLEQGGRSYLHFVCRVLLESVGLRQDWMYRFDNTIPRSVAHFEGDVLIWGLIDGSLHRLKGNTGKPIDMKIFPEQM